MPWKALEALCVQRRGKAIYQNGKAYNAIQMRAGARGAPLRSIPDLMLHLQELTDGTVARIRKTAEDPPRVSVYDVLQVVTGCPAYSCSTRWQRLKDSFPDVSTPCANFKFSGRGQVPTPVTDVRGIVEIIMVLPGRAAADVRKQAADTLVRYLGGDPSLVEEVAANRLTQEEMDADDPARIFGQTVESEATKRPPPKLF